MKFITLLFVRFFSLSSSFSFFCPFPLPSLSPFYFPILLGFIVTSPSLLFNLSPQPKDPKRSQSPGKMPQDQTMAAQKEGILKIKWDLNHRRTHRRSVSKQIYIGGLPSSMLICWPESIPGAQTTWHLKWNDQIPSQACLYFSPKLRREDCLVL